MSSISIQDKIKQIQDDAEAKIHALKQEAASGIAKKLSEAKDRLKAGELEVKQLQDEYALATGKTVKGEAVVSKRARLSAEQKESLALSVFNMIKAAKGGVKFGAIAAGFPNNSPSAIRDALKSLGRKVTSAGAKSTTTYSVK